MTVCQQENNELVKDFLKRTFFKAWKQDKNKPIPIKYGNFKKLELQVSAVCDLKCKYCYYDRYSQKSITGGIGLYPNDISQPRKVLKNIDILFKYFEKEKMYPEFDIFSGELFATELGFSVLEKCIYFYIRNKVKNRCIIIPSNMSFIEDEDKVERVEALINKTKNSGNELYISASVDGKFCDNNRPFKSGLIERDYDKIFQFCKKYNYSFHPMIYHKEIENWIYNFLWFQDMFKKHGMKWDSIYLLEVRNKGWTVETVKKANELWKFIIKWTNTNIRPNFKNDNDFINNIIINRTFNLFSMFSTVGRGITCSKIGRAHV